MTLTQARKLVVSYTAAQLPRDEVTVQQTAQRMVQHNECVWHALSQVTGKPCWCAKCKP